ncbi:MAG: biliverdin-producing heme oxygenase [Massilia sp.]
MNDPLLALRAATARQHALLDSGLAIGAADASLADYRDHLLMLRAWLAPIERWLAGFDDGPQGPDAPPPLARLALIEADLAEPAMAPYRSAGDNGAVLTTPWPVRASAAYRWGVCYVVEGAQLGGAVLYQRLADRLAPHPLRYLRGREGGPGERWRALTVALRAQLDNPSDIAQACAGAGDAFDRILALRPAATHASSPSVL